MREQSTFTDELGLISYCQKKIKNREKRKKCQGKLKIEKVSINVERGMEREQERARESE